MKMTDLNDVLAEALGVYDAAAAEWRASPRLNTKELYKHPTKKETRTFVTPQGRTETSEHVLFASLNPTFNKGNTEYLVEAQWHAITLGRELYTGPDAWARKAPQRWVQNGHERGGYVSAKVTPSLWTKLIVKSMRPADNAKTITYLFGSSTPTTDLLGQILSNVCDVAGEIRASKPPRSGSLSDHLLRWWVKRGPSDTVTHREVIVEYMAGFKHDASYRRDPQKTLPQFASDPVWSFLITYAKKLGAPSSNAGWALRNSARELVA